MKLNVFRRGDGRWAWHLLAENGQIVATDGGQGYENKGDAVDMATKLFEQLPLRSFSIEDTA